jgi:hypothetical protein
MAFFGVVSFQDGKGSAAKAAFASSNRAKILFITKLFINRLLLCVEW